MDQLYVESTENSGLIKEIYEEAKFDPEGFYHEIRIDPPIIDIPKKTQKNNEDHKKAIDSLINSYYKRIREHVINPSNKDYEKSSIKLENKFCEQMEKMMGPLINKGASNKPSFIGFYAHPMASIIWYQDGGDFFKKEEIKSRWEAKTFNFFESESKRHRNYEAMGTEIQKKGPKSEIVVDEKTGTLYVTEYIA